MANENVKHEDNERVVISIVRNHIPFSKMIEFVDAIVKLSFDQDKKFHKYLRDYAEALTILEVYTDYAETKEKQDFDTIMSIRYSDLWENDIVPAIQNDYEILTNYVDEEVYRAIAPFATVDKTLTSIGEAASKLVEVLGSLNTDNLASLNVAELDETLNSLRAKSE